MKTYSNKYTEYVMSNKTNVEVGLPDKIDRRIKYMVMDAEERCWMCTWRKVRTDYGFDWAWETHSPKKIKFWFPHHYEAV